MAKWKEYKLGDIMQIIGGGTPKTSIGAYWNGNIPWLSVVDFNTGKKYVSQTEKCITEEGLENSSTKLLDKSDIIVSARGTVGAIAVLTKKMAFNQSCYGIRAKELIASQNYLYYLLRDSISGLLQIAHGGVFDTITRETFDNIDITLPPLPEQEAIAEVLSSLDNKIDLLHRQNKALEAMAETLFRQWFVEEAQKDWEEVKLGNVADFYNGKSRPKETLNGDVPIYGGNGILGYTDQYNYDGKQIIIGRVGAYCGSLYLENNKVWVSDNALVAMPKKKGHTYYLYYLLKTLELNSMAEGSSHPLLTQGLLKSIEIIKPIDNKILEYEQFVQALRNKIETNQSQIRTLTQLRDTLLPKLMSGEVRVRKK